MITLLFAVERVKTDAESGNFGRLIYKQVLYCWPEKGIGLDIPKIPL